MHFYSNLCDFISFYSNLRDFSSILASSHMQFPGNSQDSLKSPQPHDRLDDRSALQLQMPRADVFPFREHHGQFPEVFPKVPIKSADFLTFSFQSAQSLDEIHLIGVTSMFIASKFEEIYPFKLKLVHEKIAHRKISVSALKLKEHEILQTLDFSLLSPTCHEFVGLSVEFLDDRAQIKQKTKKYLKKVCVYLLKMTLHDYEITAKYHAHVLAAACIFVSFKIIENLDAEFRSELMVTLFL